MKRFPLIALAACGAPEPPPAVPDPAAAIAPAPVQVAEDQPDFPGVVVSRHQKVIPAEFAGRIEEIYVHSRKRVKAGEIVAKLDASELIADAAQLRAQESSAGAEAGAIGASARAADNQLKTEQRLHGRGFQSRNAVTAARARYFELRGQIGAAGARARSFRVKREQLEEQIAKARLPAPIDGVITIVKAKDGEVVAKGAPIARVFDDRDLMIRFAVPKTHRAKVHVGQRVELRLPNTNAPIWATVERIADEEPPITFSVVVADIDDSKLRPDEIQVATEGRVRIAEARPQPPASVPPQPDPTTQQARPSPQPQPHPAGATR